MSPSRSDPLLEVIYEDDETDEGAVSLDESTSLYGHPDHEHEDDLHPEPERDLQEENGRLREHIAVLVREIERADSEMARWRSRCRKIEDERDALSRELDRFKAEFGIDRPPATTTATTVLRSPRMDTRQLRPQSMIVYSTSRETFDADAAILNGGSPKDLSYTPSFQRGRSSISTPAPFSSSPSSTDTSPSPPSYALTSGHNHTRGRTLPPGAAQPYTRTPLPLPAPSISVVSPTRELTPPNSGYGVPTHRGRLAPPRSPVPHAAAVWSSRLGENNHSHTQTQSHPQSPILYSTNATNGNSDVSPVVYSSSTTTDGWGYFDVPRDMKRDRDRERAVEGSSPLVRNRDGSTPVVYSTNSGTGVVDPGIVTGTGDGTDTRAVRQLWSSGSVGSSPAWGNDDASPSAVYRGEMEASSWRFSSAYPNPNGHGQGDRERERERERGRERGRPFSPTRSSLSPPPSISVSNRPASKTTVITASVHAPIQPPRAASVQGSDMGLEMGLGLGSTSTSTSGSGSGLPGSGSGLVSLSPGSHDSSHGSLSSHSHVSKSSISSHLSSSLSSHSSRPQSSPVSHSSPPSLDGGGSGEAGEVVTRNEIGTKEVGTNGLLVKNGDANGDERGNSTNRAGSRMDDEYIDGTGDVQINGANMNTNGNTNENTQQPQASSPYTTFLQPQNASPFSPMSVTASSPFSSTFSSAGGVSMGMGLSPFSTSSQFSPTAAPFSPSANITPFSPNAAPFSPTIGTSSGNAPPSFFPPRPHPQTTVTGPTSVPIPASVPVPVHHDDPEFGPVIVHGPLPPRHHSHPHAHTHTHPPTHVHPHSRSLSPSSPASVPPPAPQRRKREPASVPPRHLGLEHKGFGMGVGPGVSSSVGVRAQKGGGLGASGHEFGPGPAFGVGVRNRATGGVGGGAAAFGGAAMGMGGVVNFGIGVGMGAGGGGGGGGAVGWGWGRR